MSTQVDTVAEPKAVTPPPLHTADSASSDLDEKRHIHDHEHEEELDLTFDDHDVTRPFPIDPDAPEEPYQLTFRAIFVGCILGAIVGASNIYLGLKTGFTFGPQLFGALFGFVILKAWARILPESGIIARIIGGGPFGPKENCTVQSAATAAGGLGIIFVSGIPAMYRLGLLSFNPQDDIGKLIAMTTCAGFFGVFFVIPLRKYYIVYQKLTFPTPAATAYTIRSLHSGVRAAEIARKKAKALGITFIIVFVYKVMTGYAPGIIYDWHIGWTLSRIGFTSIVDLENYNWLIEFTPAFYGAGMLSGMNASWSFFGGAILAWGIIAPSIVRNGLAFGTPIEEGIVSYNGLSFSNPERYVTAPSPRYWLLWPGVLMMLLYSFADIFMSLVPSMRAAFNARNDIKFNPRALFTKRTELDPDEEDRTPLEDRVPWSWWIGGLFLSTVMCCAILATTFPLNVGEALLALVLGFLFSFIGVQSSGATDINPVSTVAKASQLVFGGIGKGTGMEEQPAQMFNLTAGVVAAGAAAQASDMTGDLKTGYLLGAKPKNQFIAQLCGSVVAVFLTSGLFILFTRASPCILYPPEDGNCTYGAPSVAAWAAVAVAVSSPRLPIPPSSGYTAIGLSIFAVITVVIKYLWLPKKYWVYVPNWNAVGLAFVLPQTYYALAMAVGATITWRWSIRNPKSYDLYMFAISAGLLAGEGLGGVFQALLAVVGVDGTVYGTAIGCPLNEFCG